MKTAWNIQRSCGLFRQSSGHQQYRYEKRPETDKARWITLAILWLPSKTGTKISLEHSKFLWIIMATFRSP